MEKESKAKQNEVDLVQKDIDAIKTKKEDVSKKIIELDGKEKTFKEFIKLLKEFKNARNVK